MTFLLAKALKLFRSISGKKVPMWYVSSLPYVTCALVFLSSVSSSDHSGIFWTPPSIINLSSMSVLMLCPCPPLFQLMWLIEQWHRLGTGYIVKKRDSFVAHSTQNQDQELNRKVLFVEKSWGAIGHHPWQELRTTCVRLQALHLKKNHKCLVMEVYLMNLCNPHHFPKALPVNTIVSALTTWHWRLNSYMCFEHGRYKDYHRTLSIPKEPQTQLSIYTDFVFH